MTVIKVKNLSKVYRLYDSPKDRLKEAIHPLKKKYHRDFYALNDISFNIKKGEIVGIIGKNGSGKSTLLTIITGLLSPTYGTIEVNGKVSALLELGAGFNPEYTGIENIYLNGMLMGFRRSEMGNKVEEIIAFADIGDFIYQPVKMYSSGMYVRLAFAVAINVDPDILIVDEALAVGDIRFQQKCYRKINEFRAKNKTILFCTHDTGAVLNLCSKCFWIDDGQIKESGEPEEIVKKYQAYMYYEQDVKKEEKKESAVISKESLEDQKIPWQDVGDCSFFGEGGAKITHVCFYEKESGKLVNTLKGDERVILGVRVVAFKNIHSPIIGFIVKNSYGVYAFGTNTFQEIGKLSSMNDGAINNIFFLFTIPPLTNGNYSIDVAVAEGTQKVHEQHCWKYDVLTFSVENIGEKYNSGYIYLNSKDVIITINKS